MRKRLHATANGDWRNACILTHLDDEPLASPLLLREQDAIPNSFQNWGTNVNRKSARIRATLLRTVATGAFATMLALSPARAVVVNDNDTPRNAVDKTDVTGIGQMVIDNGDGTVGLCTGTLINPRTVIFAAHCVNERDAGAYGAGTGGVPIGFGFQANTLNGIISWLSSGYQTDPGSFFYNVSHVAYNPHSLDLGPNNNFLQGDVAIATLDMPASNIPTWTMLFSPLPSPDDVTAMNGTGYHVTISGYGTNGTGTTGQGGIDFRRRSAENMVGLLGSLDDVDGFLFGVPDGLPQNLYMVDFDDPKRGTIEANPFDFNVFKDDAQLHEGITGPGDSGGPLIIDQAFGEGAKTVIGVLSGGSRFFAAQPGASYGTTSFYQPLYLFWDWIAENNPYRYVTNTAGDGDWFDPDHWTTLLDPAYQIVGPDGKLVNGIPTTPGAGITGDTPKFGQICFQGFGADICGDLGTGAVLVDGEPVNATESLSDSGRIATHQIVSGGPATIALPGAAGQGGTFSTRIVSAQPVGSGTDGSQSAEIVSARPVATAALPAPTLENGLPGATGFVPNNVDPSPGNRPFYFDVTLAAAGTTTLDDFALVDRLTLAGPARLAITEDGFLGSLIDITQFGGGVHVDGNLVTLGDYALIGGLLSGNGAVTSNYLTNVMGVIAPGEVGTTGTLTVNGNLILSSGSKLAIDLGAGGDSDVIAVRFNPFSQDQGIANLGGVVLFGAADGYRPRFGDEHVFLTAEGGITGTFDAGSAFSAILYPTLIYGPNSVAVRILARDYADVVDTNSAVQASYAQLLDQNRPNYDNLSTLFGELDLLDLNTLEATLETMAPRTETTKTALGRIATESLSRLYRDRIAYARSGNGGGTLAMIGQPLQLASLAASDLPMQDRRMSDSGSGMAVAPNVTLADNVSAFIAGGYLNGHSRPMPSLTNPGHDDLDGWYIAAGGEVMPGDGNVVGASLAYSDTDGDATVAQHAQGKLYQGTLYGAHTMAGGLVLSGQASAGLFSTDTRRRFTAGTTNYDLRQSDHSLAVSAELGIGKDLGNPDGIIVTPNAALRYSYIGLSTAAETGGDAALAVHRKAYDSLQGRIGLDVGGSLNGIAPRLTAAYVHDFLDQPNSFGANFVGGIGPNAPFALPTSDRDWGEIGGGLKIGSGNISVDLAIDTTVARKDTNYQTYRAGVTFRF